MKFTDTVTVAGTRRRDDGYLIADARVARTGIQIYAGWEVGKPEMDVVRVYRPESEVFARDTLASFAHRPITNDHPDEQVTADNWKEHAVGQSGDEIARDGTFIRVPLMVADGKTIADIEGGKRELSAGYSATLDWTAGTSPEGEAYDAVQRNIKANHIAVVRHGRAGSQVRIGDGAEKWGASPVNLQTADEKEIQMDLRKVLVDGLQVETTDAGATAINKLQKDADTLRQQLSDATTEHSEAIAAKDAELAKKDAEIDELKGKVLDATALDKLVAARADLINTAKAIAKDVKTEGLSDADIRKAVVVAKLGDAAVKDKAQAYIDARFDILAEDAVKSGANDPLRSVVKGGVKTSDAAMADEDKAYAASIADLNRKTEAA